MGRKKRTGRGESGQIDWFDSFEQIVFGVLNITPNELDQYTYRQLFNKWMGAIEHGREHELESWKRARFVAMWVVNSAGKQYKENISEHQLRPLPGDEPKTTVFSTLTKEQIHKAFTT